MADNNNIWDTDETLENEDLELDDEDSVYGDDLDEGSRSVISEYIDSYCDNLVNPDPEKCISPKTLYITLGASALGAVLVFLLIGWLLCYAPINTTGFYAKDFISEFNAIVSESEVNAVIDRNIASLTVSGSDVSGSDLKILYPDFSDLTIPEDADLENGVPLCGGDILLKADLRGGKIKTLEIAVAEGCESYNFEQGYFSIDADADGDYSKFQHYAAVGKARLALHNLVCRADGTEIGEYDINEAVNYGVIMENFAYYVYSVYGVYDPSITYYEDNAYCSMAFDSSRFCLSVDTVQKTIIQPDNGIYRFFDGIFGEKAVSDSDVDDQTTSDSTAVTSEADTVSSTDVSGTDPAASVSNVQ